MQGSGAGLAEEGAALSVSSCIALWTMEIFPVLQK